MSKRKRPIERKASPSSDWEEAVRYFNTTGRLRAQDICAVIGDPVGGVIVAAEPDTETAYRLAGYGG
jgi:hypothetical protein